MATYDELLRLRAAREAAGEREAGDDRVGEFAYDSPRGAARKVELAAALGLAGVMVWEVGQDARPAHARGGLLLGALAEAAASSSVGWEPDLFCPLLRYLMRVCERPHYFTLGFSNSQSQTT